MKNKNIILAFFIIVALVQLYFPAKMIWDNEDILTNGVEYKFKTRPIDPKDPFRGKYINLDFDENSITINNKDDWTDGQKIFVLLSKDEEGYAKISSVSNQKPNDNIDFVKAKVYYVNNTSPPSLIVEYPFNRYYMEESKAYNAELLHRDSSRDTINTTYALVRIKEGNPVLKDVLINEVSIKEAVKGYSPDK